jgi:N6-L-threonylcarbamoyladenine synthase
LVEKTILAAKEKGICTVTAGGGVVANGYLREKLTKECEKHAIKVVLPPKNLCTDNAAMIGCAAYYEYMAGVRDGLDLNANPSLRLGDR